jgi:hypothetical protein
MVFRKSASNPVAVLLKTVVGRKSASPDGCVKTARGVQIKCALASNTTGFQNIATGSGALLNNITGLDNTATGQGALATNVMAAQNTATGEGARSGWPFLVDDSTLFTNTASNNTA